MPGCVACRGLFGALPVVGFRDGAANPERQQRRREADQKDIAVGKACHHVGRHAGQQDADVDARLEHGRQPVPPAFGPGLGQQRRPYRPFAANAQGRQEAKDQKVPPLLSQVAGPREDCVGQDRQHQRPAAPEAIAQPAKKGPAQRPADHERRLDPRAVEADVRVLRLDAQELRHKRRRDQRVEVHVQPVEQPAEPGSQAGLPLGRIDL